MESNNAAWLDRLLFPTSRLLGFVGIICVSCLFSYLLTGRQIHQANWGLIDDHEVLFYLGPSLHLSPGDIWETLLTKTEVGLPEGSERFRPSYYLFKLIETSLFGPNVHLWYLLNTACFAVFLSSIWWTMSRFVGFWLGGALTASIALLSLWAQIWSRLGPSEIFGAAFVGLMLFAADAVLFSANSATRNLGATATALAAIALAGLKETFLPLAAGSVAVVFIFAVAKKRISPLVAGVLSLIVLACLIAIGFVVFKEMRATGGMDYYGKPLGPFPTITFAIKGAFEALLQTWWLFLPVAALRILKVVPHMPLRHWIADSAGALGLYVFLIAMYAAQCGLYRMSFPQNSRYDFPAMLLVPLTCCILACEVCRKLRKHFPDLVMNRVQLIAAVFLAGALTTAHWGTPPALATAVKRNIEVTRSFYKEIEGALRAAKDNPDYPIILEAYGPGALEGVYSLERYLRALGSRNPISVRLHWDAREMGPFYERLQQRLSDLENDNTMFVPLAKSLSILPRGCVSIGLYGPGDTACAAFRISES